MEKKTIFFPTFHFLGNGGHLGFYGIHQGTYNFKTASANAVKSCTHIEDMYINEEKIMYMSVLSFVE